MKSQFISPQDLEIANCVLNWAKEYLMKENPNINRPNGNNVVCPFVSTSIDNNSFYIVVHKEVNGESVEHIETIMYSYLEPFKSQGPFGTNDKQKKALLVVFPNIPTDQSRALDIVHQNIKTQFVSEGLMVGQFHPNCEEKGIYNLGFLVSIAPYPLIAIRHMTIHDILFLGENELWFNEYNIRFGEKFKEPKTIEDFNKHLIIHYQKAKRKFSK